MRVHRLRVDAFGSFAGSETIDFDRLGQAGLFLLTGPTGAGKTTVLDAVGFALYGQVPGERDGRSGCAPTMPRPVWRPRCSSTSRWPVAGSRSPDDPSKSVRRRAARA